MSDAHISPPGTNYLTYPKGIKSWFTTLDHKRIGLMYLASVIFFLLLGGFFALLVRLELFKSGTQILDAATYNKAFTYHGAIMVFMVIIPSIPAAMGNFVMPMMLGAKDVAFPRLNLLSYYIYMAGAIFALCTLFFKGVDTGWTFYTPYSTKTAGAAAMMVMAAFIMGFSSILTGLNFIATIHKLRCPGLTWGRLPLFVWALYATSVLQLLATPVLALTLCLMALERVLGIGIFDPALGGDPVLFQHFFWFYSHPAVYIMILPAMGVISELITVFSRKNIFGYKAMAAATFGIALVAFIVWGHHMFVSGQSKTAGFVFSLLTMFVAVPTGVKVFSWLATLYKGQIYFETPMLYVFSFLFVFLIGGLTGIPLAAIAGNMFLTDTYYVVAHFHYVMVGGTIMAFLGAIHYWFPKFFGKMYSNFASKLAWLLVFAGFNITFFPQFILGSRGMPRRYFAYLPEFTELNRISTVGTWFIAAGFILTAAYLIIALRSGKKASSNPWNGLTLEWESPSPPPIQNFETDPVCKYGPYDYHAAGRA